MPKGKPSVRVVNLSNKSNLPTVLPQQRKGSKIGMRSKGIIPHGTNNLFPYAIAAHNRKSGAHRGIINRKSKFFAGHGFNCGKPDN